MILILGGSGFVGTAICRELEAHDVLYRNIRRREIDYTQRDCLMGLIRETKPSFLINAAGFTGKPNVDACEIQKAACLMGNAVLPGVIRDVCEQLEVPWGHVSSGCIFTGNNSAGTGFAESDNPNFCFRTNNCSFYSGCKALGEECLDGAENVYVWRLRIPFNHQDSQRNYLSKVMRYDRLLDVRNSISHLDEFARVCRQSWERRIPFGTYNVTNPGSVTTREVATMMRQELKLDREFLFFENEADFMQSAAKAPRSSCVMDHSKLAATGIEMTEVHDAIRMSLQSWAPRGSAFQSQDA